MQKFSTNMLTFLIFIPAFLLLFVPTGIVSEGGLLDYFIAMDQGYKIQSGLLPYTDFWSPLGPLYYLQVYIVSSLVEIWKMPIYLNWVLFIPLVLISNYLSYTILKNKTQAFLFTITITTWLIGPFMIGGAPFKANWIALYNTASLTIFSLFLLLFLNKENSKTIGILYGFLALSLIFLKLPYGIIASLILVYASIKNKNISYAGIVIVLGILAWNVFDSHSFLNYFEALLKVNKISNGFERMMWRIGFFVMDPMLILVLLANIILFFFSKQKGLYSIISIISWGMTWFDHGAYPVLLSILFFTHFEQVLFKNLAIIFTLFCLSQTYFTQINQIILDKNIPSQGLSKLRTNPDSISAVQDIETINQELLAWDFAKNQGWENKKIVQIQSYQILPYLLKSQALKTDAWFDFKRTYNFDYPPVELVENADIILISLNPTNYGNTEPLWFIYEKYIKENFVEGPENIIWKAFIRKN